MLLISIEKIIGCTNNTSSKLLELIEIKRLKLQIIKWNIVTLETYKF